MDIVSLGPITSFMTSFQKNYIILIFCPRMGNYHCYRKSIVLCKNIFFDYEFNAFYLKFECYFMQILSYYVKINCTDIKFDSGFNNYMKKYKN